MTLLGACGTVLCLSSQINTIIPEKNYNGKIRRLTFKEISYMTFSRNFVNYLSFKPQYQHAFLHTVLHTFFLVLLKRICSIIKTFHVWWSFQTFSWPVVFYQAVSLLGEIGCWSLVIKQVFDHALYFVGLAVQSSPSCIRGTQRRFPPKWCIENTVLDYPEYFKTFTNAS